jgi:two-component system KDP operon response regulator KdpE
MKTAPTILVIDDEAPLRRLVRLVLESEGFSILDAESGRQGLEEAVLHKPDLVLLDLGLPDQDGMEVLRRMREWSDVPVLVLSVRDGSAQKVGALEAGADDYVTKPFDSPELVARARGLLRRRKKTEDVPVFTQGELMVDLSNRNVTRSGQLLDLTATEYSLLRCLVRHAGRVLTHAQILREVWGPKAEEQRQYLRVYIAALRRKLGSDIVIKTESGIGYRLCVPAPAAS